MTVSEIVDKGELFAADFKDDFGLIYAKTGHYIGFSKFRGLRIGNKPYMEDGIWFIIEDEIAQKNHEDVEMGPGVLALRRIA